MNLSGENMNDFQKFLSDKTFFIVIERFSSIGQVETFYLLEYGGWNMDCTQNLFDVYHRENGNTVDALVMKDGKIEHLQLDSTMHVQVGIRHIDSKAKRRMNEEYGKWKRGNESR